MLQRSDGVQTVLQQLRQDIILYRYEDGAPLRELELAEQYQCSRSSVRGALLVLEQEGLIATHPNGTRTVKIFLERDLENLYHLREYLELTAVEQILKDTGDFTFLTELLREIASCPDDMNIMLDIDSRFHKAVVESSRNRALLLAWNNVFGVLSEIFRLNTTTSAEYERWFCETFKARHLALGGKLLACDVSAADTFREHIAEARSASLKAIITKREKKHE